jgi:carboxymethylenebutenolidase
MVEREVDIATPDGAMNTVIFHPEFGGPFPLAICFMDSCGVRPDFLEMAKRLAATGYCVATPNMYYRKAREVDLDPDRIDFDDSYDDGRALMWALNSSVTLADCAIDVRALIDWFDTYPQALGGPVGAYGYCLGGWLAIGVAAHIPERIAAAASFHGGGFIRNLPDSIQHHASKIRAEIYLGHAGTDKYIPLESIKEFDGVLAKARVRRRFETYKDAHHGWTIPGRRVFHEPSSLRAWERLFSLFRRNLPQAPLFADAPEYDPKITEI